MRTRSFAFAAALALLCNVVSADINLNRADKLEGKVDDTTLMQTAKGQQQFSVAAQEVIDNGGCDPNVCFALDGSASIPPPDYALQVNFVQLIAAIVGADPRAMFAAAQYGLELEEVQPLTSNAAAFLSSLTQSTFIRAPATFIEPGVLWCTSELGKVSGEPAKLVLLGDGRSSIADRILASQAVSDFINESSANEVCAVGVGFDDPILLEQIVGRADRVLEVTDWPKVLNILDDLVKEICNINGGGSTPVTTPPPPTTTTRLPPGPNCPCQCIVAASDSDRDERRARRRARNICRNPAFSNCQVELCIGQTPAAYKCC